MTKISDNTVLLLIDVQKGFDDKAYWGKRNNEQAEEFMSKLLQFWRKNQRPIIHVKHNSREAKSPLRPHLPGNEFKEAVKPISGEKIFEKEVNSAFIGTELEKYLQENSLDTLVIIGLTTDHCVSTTTRMAANLGFKVFLVDEAIATFDRIGHDGKAFSADEIHKSALASLHNEFAQVISVNEIISPALK